MNETMRRLCAIIGHRWQAKDGSNFRVCTRCGDNGWVV